MRTVGHFSGLNCARTGYLTIVESERRQYCELTGYQEGKEMPNNSDPAIPMRALLAGARQKQQALLKLTQQLVTAESPSDEKAGVDGCVGLVAAHARGLGGRVIQCEIQ